MEGVVEDVDVFLFDLHRSCSGLLRALFLDAAALTARDTVMEALQDLSLSLETDDADSPSGKV
jgi:hypothetical protein